jgi:hypothetical protein
MVSSKLGLSKGLGSMGDLTSLFDIGAASVVPLSAPSDQPLLLAAKQLPGATCGVDTPPLSSCSDGDALLVPDECAIRVPKRART